MNLKISMPENAQGGEIFSLPFNISENGEQTEGHFTADRETIRIYGRDGIKSYEIKLFDEFEVNRKIGCSMIRGKLKDSGRWQFFCSFTQTYYVHYAELAKILDYYAKTGVLAETSDAPEPTCRRCGASLNGAESCPYCVKSSSTVKRLISRLKPYKKAFAAIVALTLVSYAADLVAPALQRYIIDDVIEMETPDMGLFFIIAAAIVVLALFNSALLFIIQPLNIKISSGFIRDLRRDLFNKTQELSMRSISKRTSGEIIRRLSDDARTVQNFVTGNGKEMILNAVALTALAAIMLVTNWKLALLVIIPMPIAAWVSVRVMNAIMDRDGRSWRKVCDSSRYLHDVLSGIRVVKSYGSEERETERYTGISENVARTQKNGDCTWYLLNPIVRCILAVGEFLMLYFGASMVFDLQVSLGELVQFTNYVYMLYGPLEWLVNLPRQLSQTLVASGKIFEVLDEQTEIFDSENSVEPQIKGGIAFEHVSFGYTPYDPVLKDISCEIKQGEMIGIVGHSGVGKSTMINLLMRLYDPTDGAIKIDGTDLRHMSSEALHSQLGVVLQETFLFNGTVLENISYAKPEASFEEVIQAAKIANCHDFIVRLPNGYNTYVGEKGYSLSGGERQRVSIARAILRDPKILILDEATASLDAQTEKQIQEALKRLIKGRTTIAIAHRLSTLSSADRLIVLDKGKLAEMGTHAELMRKKGVYYSLVMAQRTTAAIKQAAV